MDRVAAILESISKGQPDIGAIHLAFGDAMRTAAAKVFNAYNPRVDEAIVGKSVDDVVEDVLVEVFEKGMPENLTRGSLRNYLVTAARNRAVDAQRQTRFDQPLPHDAEAAGHVSALSPVLRIPPRTKRQTT